MKKDNPRYQSILDKQLADWPNALAAGREGNPFATLCDHCRGRHKPPHDEICPHSPPDISGTKNLDNRRKPHDET